MYYFINIILLIIVFCILFSCIRQKNVKKAIRHMTCSEKCRLISDILSPLGYCYSSDWDIISTRNDAWQGAFCNSLIACNIPSLYFHCRGTRTHIHYTDGCPLSPICPENISLLRRIRIRWVNFSNRLSCHLYRYLTRHFCCTLDKILYLYKLLPFTVRRILRCMKGARH